MPTTVDTSLLPAGQHWGLTITTSGLVTTGSYITATPKLVWHTTEIADFATSARVLADERDQPHVLIDPHSGRVQQMIALDQYAKALEHPSGTPETNRAHCIQVEICGFAKDSQGWPDVSYQHLGALAALLEHRQGIARVSEHPFQRTPHRIAPAAFAATAGHIGHQHVPSQPSNHWDPGALDINKLFAAMAAAERQFS
jgi:hypothetical protein